jgi:hypothetical protein
MMSRVCPRLRPYLKFNSRCPIVLERHVNVRSIFVLYAKLVLFPGGLMMHDCRNGLLIPPSHYGTNVQYTSPERGGHGRVQLIAKLNEHATPHRKFQTLTPWAKLEKRKASSYEMTAIPDPLCHINLVCGGMPRYNPTIVP